MVLFDPYRNLVNLEEQISCVYFTSGKTWVWKLFEFLWGRRDLGDHSVQSPYFAVKETEYQI